MIINIFDKYSIDWEAISAIATFAAVLLALYPIWNEDKKRRLMAANLRGRALIKLHLLRHPLELLSQQTLETRRIGKSKFSDEELNAIRTLEAMLPSATVLHPDEQDSLIITIGHLGLIVSLMQSHETHKVPEQTVFTLDLLKRCIANMQAQQYRPNRKPEQT